MFFRIDRCVGQGYIMPPWLFNVYMDGVLKEGTMGMGRRGKNGDYMASCMQTNWFCVANLKKT